MLSVMEPISLAVLSGAALTEGIRFLYDQAGTLLERRRDRQQTPDVVAEPDILGEPDEVRAQALEDHIRALRSDLAPLADPAYEDSEEADGDLLWRADALRAVLECVYGTRVVFSDENRPATEVFSQVRVEEVRGYAAAVRGDAGTKGRLRARMHVRQVEAGGEVIGVDLRHGDS